MKLLTTGLLLTASLLFVGCGGGSSSADTTTNNYSGAVQKVFGAFTDCTLNIEEHNRAGSRPVECSDNTPYSDWNITSVDVKNSGGFKGELAFNGSPLKSVEILDSNYSISTGEESNATVTLYGSNSVTGEEAYMEVPLLVKGVSDGYYDVATVHTYPVLILNVNFTNETTGKSAEYLHNTAFGFGLGQANHAMLRNSASTRTFIPVSESFGVVNDGVITVDINESSFTTADYQNVAVINRYIKEAVIKADPFVDFKSYDVDGDGVLTEKELSITVCFPDSFYKNTSISGLSIPMAYESYNSNDGIRVLNRPYVLTTNFVNCISCNNFDSSTFFHEEGHTVWNLIDLYDVDFSSDGTGRISLMDYGSMATGKYSISSPSIMQAYSQVRAGFIIPTEVNTTQRVTLYPAKMNEHHNIIKVVSNRSVEFFYLENYLFSDVRPQPYSDYSEYKKGGLLITKVNISTGAYTNSSDNNRIVDIIAPEYGQGNFIVRTFFGESDSIIDVKYSDGNNSGVSFENITFNGDGSIGVDIVVD